MEDLQARCARQASDRLALGMGKDPTALVFTRIDGEAMQPDSVTKTPDRNQGEGEAGQLPCAAPHSRNRRAARACVHPKIVSERLGDARIAITMDTYTQALPGLQENAAQRIDAALRSAMLSS